MRRREEIGNRAPERDVAVTRILGYRPTCECNAGEPRPSLVFDPFAGSGTTLQVAKALGRHWLGCEMSEAYAKLAEGRINTKPIWARMHAKKTTPKVSPNQRKLFAEE